MEQLSETIVDDAVGGDPECEWNFTVQQGGYPEHDGKYRMRSRGSTLIWWKVYGAVGGLP